MQFRERVVQCDRKSEGGRTCVSDTPNQVVLEYMAVKLQGQVSTEVEGMVDSKT